MMRKTLALCLLSIAVVSGNAFAGAEGRMTGKITDAATKAPIANVVITVISTGQRNFKQDFKGDKDGTYRMLLVDATLPYKMTWSAPGYQPYSEAIKLKIGDTTNKDVALTSATATPAVAAGKPAEAPKPDPGIVAYNEGAALYNEGKKAEASAKFQEAVAAKPDLIAGWSALAKVSIALKDYPKAINSANKVLEIDPEETDMYGVLYEAYTATGDKAKAAEAKAKLPADPATLFNEAARLINANKDAQAEPLLKQAIAANDKFAPAYYELGMIYLRSGKSAEAKANLLKYVELDPNGKDVGTARDTLAYLK